MPNTILIVDDESESPIVNAVKRRLDEEGWLTQIIKPEIGGYLGDEFETLTLYTIANKSPDGILLDVRLGEFKEDQFKGLDILQKIVHKYPRLPVLMFTQYAQGPDRETAVRGALQWDAPVDFIDKLASPDEVVLRLRRLIGSTPEKIPINENLYVDTIAKTVFAGINTECVMVEDVNGVKFDIFRELAATWYRSPGELVPFSRLERYFDGDEARGSLRVRIREIKISLGKALGISLGASDLIINVRDQGYRLVPPKV